MPPSRHHTTKASSASPRKKCNAKFERLPYYSGLMMKNILQSQQTDANGEFTDTLLICDGGTIRVHAFILQAASPLIQSVIMSQGENYPYIREILLPDFSVKEIEKMLNLVYKGYVDLRDDKEALILQETLKFFEISAVNFCTDNFDKIKGSLKVQELNRIPQDIFKADAKIEHEEAWEPSVVVVDPSIDKKEIFTSPGEIHQLRRSGRAPKPIVKLDKLDDEKDKDTKSDDSDYNHESGNDSSVEEVSGDESVSRKRARQSMDRFQPVVKLPRMENAVIQKAVASSSTTPTGDGAMKPIIVGGGDANDEAEKEDSSTDTEDEGWEKPNFKDKEWFSRESRRCQSCNKTFDKPGDASLCITSHKCLRCYFCFKVYSTTDVLFKHFRKRHKQAGRDSTLICPFCDQAIPYKSVSCHVISTHLRVAEKHNDDHKPVGRNRVQITSPKGPGRPPAVPAIANTPSRSKSPSRSRSRSQSTEVIASGSNSAGNNSQKKIKNVSVSPVEKDKKKRGKQLTLLDLKKKLVNNGNSERERKVRDLDVTLEKVTSFGRTVTFRLQKKRL